MYLKTNFSRSKSPLDSTAFSSQAGRSIWAQCLQTVSTEEQFNCAALNLFRWQFQKCHPYRALAQSLGKTPETVVQWKEIPAMPQRVFKETTVACFDIAEAQAIYETSGTTIGHPGRQYLNHVDIYETVSVGGAIRAGLLADPMPILALASPPEEAPRSSLSAMFSFWMRHKGLKGSDFFVRRNRLEMESLRKILEEKATHHTPVALIGTAFAFVHLIDAWKSQAIALPKNSWALETGGFKGRSRELSKPDLYREIQQTFGVADSQIWNEYGMSELSSQAYARGTHGLHQTPPWARVLIVDPRTGLEVPVGKTGVVRWIDLANVDSVLAVQTQDLAVRQARGFQLLGRASEAEKRGCSLTAEEWRR